MNVLDKTVKTAEATVEKTADATKKTGKTFFWVAASVVVGLMTALLADPEVSRLLMANPKAMLWIPVVNVMLVFANKFFKE